jgi:protein required for attachment to host cells
MRVQAARLIGSHEVTLEAAMPKPLRTRFVIADGARARWVDRSDRADDFVTSKEMAARPGHAEGPQGVVFASAGGPRFSVEERDSAARAHRLAFAQEVANAINAEANERGFERLAVVAPARVLSAIRQRLSAKASAKLARTLAKDLTKTPDHELGAWLRGLEA